MADQWTVDLEAGTVTHKSGLRLKVSYADAAGVNLNLDGALPPGIPFSDVARMMREAGEAFAAARRKRN